MRGKHDVRLSGGTTAPYTIPMPVSEYSLIALAALLVYAWLLYPLLLALAVRRHGDGGTPAVPPTDGEAPFVTVLVAAYNEADVMAQRIVNVQAMDYPPDRWRLLVGADGCTDGTAAVARQAGAGDARVVVRDHALNRGKISVLRELAGEAADAHPDGVLVLTDANTQFRPDTVRRLVAPLADPGTGATCGRLVFRHVPSGPLAPDNPAEEGFYWRMETWLKRCESALDSCLGANGAVYALRAGLFWRTVPDTVIVDDLVLGLHVRERGFRVRYVPEAVAEEDLPAVASEWGRRVRIGCGDYQALLLCRRCLLPSYGWFAWCFASHKVLRWFTPHLLVACGVLALAGVLGGRGGASPSGVAAAGLCGGLLAAAAGRLWLQCGVVPSGGAAGRLYRGARLCDHFVTMQAALLAGFVRFLRRRHGAAWARTPRASGRWRTGET